MNSIGAGLVDVWSERLGWMLVHSIWEVGTVAFAYALALLFIPRSAAGARYLAGCVALVCMIVSLPATLVVRETLQRPTVSLTTNRDSATGLRSLVAIETQ